MKKAKKVLGSFVMVTLLFGIFSCPVIATEEIEISDNKDISETDPTRVFEESEVDRLIDLANQIPIEPDQKLSQGQITTRSSLGSYPSRKGIILVTPDKYKSLPVGHAGIIYSYNTTVEANSDGVNFNLNNWYNTKTQVYASTLVKSTIAQDESAAEYAKNQIGKPYNIFYYRLDLRNSFYCSHLIYAAYIDLFGIDLNTSDFDFDGPDGVRWMAIHPMELITGPKTALIYRKN